MKWAWIGLALLVVGLVVAGFLVLRLLQVQHP